MGADREQETSHYRLHNCSSLISPMPKGMKGKQRLPKIGNLDHAWMKGKQIVGEVDITKSAIETNSNVQYESRDYVITALAGPK